MISEICAEIKNYFTYPCDRFIRDWEIKDGALTPTLDIPTDYIRIVGSRLNDGVHKRTNGSFELTDEKFHGAIWVMSPPADFLSLCAEISAWQEKNGGANSQAMGPYSSESFGGYSYSRSGGSNGASVMSWVDAYGARLRRYRRIREL